MGLYVKHTIKAKLPRKRKKRAIDSQGRQWYYNTIKLYKLTQSSKKFFEPVCKFWVNDSVTVVPFQLPNGAPAPIRQATKYW